MRTHGGGEEGKRRRRRTLIGLEEWVSGGELALSEAMEDFLEYLRFKGLAYHTRRWHRENIQHGWMAVGEAWNSVGGKGIKGNF